MRFLSLLAFFRVKQAVRWYRRRFRLFFLSVFLIWYADCLPDPLFADSTSTVLLDRNGELLGAHISTDEQWRFEECDSVPYRFRECIVQFEDRGFYSHFGVSLKGVFRALVQNLSSGERVSGGSTITMQLVRLIRKNPPRTYREKMLEMVMATRLEWSYSKEEILRLYASHAPFGNNVVGLDAAAWRFFGRPAHKLSWAESATLAVLPNAPGLIYPGRNHDRLMEKRNRLLKRLLEVGIIDKTTYETAALEPLPSRPHTLPDEAGHLLTSFMRNGRKGQTVTSSLDKRLQEAANRILEQHMLRLRENKIYNAAVLVVNVKTGEVLSYVGNSRESGAEHNNFVNCVPAPRSTGSILKPLLYAHSMDAGLITPKTLLVDVPSRFGGFSPKNFTGSFDGLVPADQALSKSLNIPMVHLLNRYGLAHFLGDLRDHGFTTLKKSAGHYGLSLILGGAEVSLFDLAKVYAHMAQWLEEEKTIPLSLVPYTGQENESGFNLDRGSIYATFEAMTEVNRPDEDNNWKYFSSSRKIAWKTGTSFGFRDAWAVGVTPDYLVATWVGNADGEGRPGLTGLEAAAPLMFEVFRQLPDSRKWFSRPAGSMEQVAICAQSGHRAGPDCPDPRKMFIPHGSLRTLACPYHRLVHLDETGQYRVDADCANALSMKHVPWFVLPSSVEKFYRQNHPDYIPVPPYSQACRGTDNRQNLAIVYPVNGQKIYLPVDFSGAQRKVTCEAAHSQPDAILFWHLDDYFVGQTSLIHQMEFQPPPGMHVLTLTDERGNTGSVRFEIVGKKQ